MQSYLLDLVIIVAVLEVIAGQQRSYGAWSPCSATCSPAVRSRTYTPCAGGDTSCQDTQSCPDPLPPCGETETTKSLYKREGESVGFTCPKKPVTEPGYTHAWFIWSRLYVRWVALQSVPGIAVDSTNKKITIRKIHRSHEGSYRCSLLNADKQTVMEYIFHFHVERTMSLAFKIGLPVAIVLAVLKITAVVAWIVIRLKQGKPIIPEILTRCIPGKGGKGSKAADSSKKASPSGYGDSDDDDDPFGSDDEEQLFLSPKKTQKVGSYRQPAGPRRSDKKKSRDEDEEDMWDSW